MNSGSDDEEILDEIEGILRDHVGKENAISSGEIQERVGIEDATGRPNTRAYIKQVIEERGLPVAGGSDGYFIITNEQELAEYVSYVQEKIKGNQERIEIVLNAVQNSDEDFE